jgi:hypothetical protein
MSWSVVHASEIGTSHLSSGTPCQDRSFGSVNLSQPDRPLLAIFISDGAGSASKGGEGAAIAVETAAALIAKQPGAGEDIDLTEGAATAFVVAIQEEIRLAAEASELGMRDYACTFIAVLASPERTLVFQIGDGGVVIDTGTGLEIAVEPMTGEYANMTHFITDERADEIVVAKTYPGPALRIAAFSDGIQRLALNLADNTPHEPFFTPFFQGLAKAPADQMERLQSLLAGFLGSTPVNERTDDDKSLAVAVWVPGP